MDSHQLTVVRMNDRVPLPRASESNRIRFSAAQGRESDNGQCLNPGHNDRRNLLWMLFSDTEERARMVRWEPAARAVLSQFRSAAGQRPDDPRFAAIAAQLTEASPQFRRWWSEYLVRDFRPATIRVDHPEIGRLSLEIFQVRPVEYPDMLMVLQVPRTMDDLQRVASLLGTQDWRR